MSNLEVALRLRLENQLSKGAEDVKRDLAEIERAAVQLGRSRGGDQLAASLDKVGTEAKEARDGIKAVEDAADKTRQALTRIDQGALDTMRQDAVKAGRAVLDIGEDADKARQALGLLRTDTSLDSLKVSAEAAENSIRQIGEAADRTERKLRDLNRAGPRAAGAGAAGLGSSSVAGPVRPGMGQEAFRGAWDRSGADAFLTLGAGSAAYALGGAVAVGGSIGAASYMSAAQLQREMGYLAGTAGVDKDNINRDVQRLRDIANETRLPFAEAYEGFKALHEAAVPWEDVLALMTSVGRTSTASGAGAATVARAYHAAMTSMGMSIADMPKASDMMLAGGNAGQFEFPDMARHLPSLLSSAAVRPGFFEGENGLASIIAAAQVIRARTGDAGSAATQLQNVLLKMDSAETQGNFSDYGIQLSEELRKAVAAGIDPLDALVTLTDRAIANGAQLNELFRDQELGQGVNALMQGRGDKVALQRELLSADGTTDRSFDRVSEDAKAGIDRLSNSVSEATFSLGDLLHKMGVTTALNHISGRLQDVTRDPVGSLSPPIGYARDWLFSSPEPGALQGGRLEVDPKIRAAIGPSLLERQEAEAAAGDAMGAYNSKLEEQGGASIGIVQTIVDQMRSMLNFTAGPTIRPTLAPAAPADAPVSGPRSSLEGGSKPVSVTQNIYSPSSKVAARMAQREQNRAVRMAQANALSDMGLA